MGVTMGKMTVRESNDGLTGEQIKLEFRRYIPWSLEKSLLLAVCHIEIIDEDLGLGELYDQAECSSQEYINMVGETVQPSKGASVRLEAESSSKVLFHEYKEEKLAIIYGRIGLIGDIRFTLEDVTAEEMHEIIQLIKEKLFNLFKVDFILTNEYVYTYYSEDIVKDTDDDKEDMSLPEVIQSLSELTFSNLPETMEEYEDCVLKQENVAKLNRQHLLMMGFQESGQHTFVIKKYKMRKVLVDDSVLVLEG